MLVHVLLTPVFISNFCTLHRNHLLAFSDRPSERSLCFPLIPIILQAFLREGKYCWHWGEPVVVQVARGVFAVHWDCCTRRKRDEREWAENL